MCGCGHPAPIAKVNNSRLGHVKGKPVRFISGHNYPRQIKTWTVDPDTGCWNWDGYTKTRRGLTYGYAYDGGHQLAHRWVYAKMGFMVPDGLELDHLCSNTLCVNPNHLEPVAHMVNMQRGRVAKLTPSEVREIRLLGSSMSQQEIAGMFGVSQANISSILRRETWTNID